jgi:phage protein D
MAHERFSIEIERQEAGDLYTNLISLEVELDDELASMFRLHIALSLGADGTWNYLDDERLRVWKQVDIGAGFVESGVERLLSGYITHVKPHFDRDPVRCSLEIWGIDGSVLMDRQEKLKDWPDKKDSDIATEIFSDYGFTPQVQDTQVIHDEAISTIIQRETDMQFLRRLALRNGFECYVENDMGYFGPPQVDAAPQPLLAAHFFGSEPNLNHFSVELNALTPANVAMFQVDRTNKEILEATVEASRQTTLGAIGAADLLAAGMSPGQVYVGMNGATGNPEMEALCQGLYHQAEWFVTGEGEIDGNRYGHVLRPRRTVTIRGVGETHSGVYYVTHVTHVFTPGGYTQSFRVKRNAIMPTGTEDFSASSESGLL